MISKKLLFEKLNNTRDLGGINTKTEKKIISKRLIRSGSLYKATENDKTNLSNIIEMIIDLRSDKEVFSKPEPELSNVKYIHLPLKQNPKEVSIIKMYAENPDGARKYMLDNYIEFITSDLSLKNCNSFVNLLLHRSNKAILWHCSAGKDRTGLATIIVLELLEVCRDSIFEDYLYSNDCLNVDKEKFTLELMKKHNIDINSIEKTSIFKKSLEYLFIAREEYFLCLYDNIKKFYGDFDGFINKGLKISDKQRYQFKNLYLV